MAPVANPLAARPPHFPATAKHVIFLFMQGGPSHIDTFDPKPLLNRPPASRLPPSVTAGLAVAVHQDERRGAGLAPDLHEVRPVGDRDRRHLSAPPGLRRRPGDRPLVLSRLVQPRSGAVHAQHRPLADGPAVPGLVGHLRPGERVGEPAGVRRHGHDRRHQGRAAGLRSRLPARHVSSRPCSATPARRCSTWTRRRTADDPGRRDRMDMVQWLNQRASRRPRAGRRRPLVAHRLLRAGVPHAGRGARGRGPRRESKATRRLCTAWTSRSPRSSAPTA